MKEFITQAKRYISKLLIYLLKKLNMPKAFEEFSTDDMEQIASIVKSVIDLDKLLGKTRSVRIDSNAEYFVLEYKRQNTIALDANIYNNPDVSINIKNDFSCIIVGLDSQDEVAIQRIIKMYLQANDFIR